MKLSTCACATPKKEITETIKTPPPSRETPKKITQKKELPKKIVKKVLKPEVPKKEVQKKVAIKKVPLKPKDMPKHLTKIEKPIEETTPVPQTQVSKIQQVQKPIIKSAPQQTSEEAYVDANIQKIVELLRKNLYYPRRARKRSIEGDVIVRFHISTDATISQIKVLSSENEILSRGAVQTIENLSNKFPRPKEDLILTLPISYHFKD